MPTIPIRLNSKLFWIVWQMLKSLERTMIGWGVVAPDTAWLHRNGTDADSTIRTSPTSTPRTTKWIYTTLRHSIHWISPFFALKPRIPMPWWENWGLIDVEVWRMCCFYQTIRGWPWLTIVVQRLAWPMVQLVKLLTSSIEKGKVHKTKIYPTVLGLRWMAIPVHLSFQKF